MSTTRYWVLLSDVLLPHGSVAMHNSSSGADLDAATVRKSWCTLTGRNGRGGSHVTRHLYLPPGVARTVSRRYLRPFVDRHRGDLTVAVMAVTAASVIGLLSAVNHITRALLRITSWNWTKHRRWTDLPSPGNVVMFGPPTVTIRYDTRV